MLKLTFLCINNCSYLDCFGNKFLWNLLDKRVKVFLSFRLIYNQNVELIYITTSMEIMFMF